MRQQDIDAIMESLTPTKAGELLGMTTGIIAEVRAKLDTLSDYEGGCYCEHFAGVKNMVPKP